MSVLLLLTLFTAGFQISDFRLPAPLLAVAESLTNRSIAWPEWEQWKRVLLVQDIKKRMHDLLGYGLALEGLAATYKPK